MLGHNQKIKLITENCHVIKCRLVRHKSANEEIRSLCVMNDDTLSRKLFVRYIDIHTFHKKQKVMILFSNWLKREKYKKLKNKLCINSLFTKPANPLN